MEIALNSGWKRVYVLGAACLISAAFLSVSTLRFVADCFSMSRDHMLWAVRLAAANAEYHELLGHELLQVRADVPAALQQYRAAAALNPHNAGYWLAVADSEQILNNVAGQRYALERAIAADPTTPNLAWAAANFFLAQGDIAMALREFKVVVGNEPGLAYSVFVLCSHAVDVGAVIRNVLPPDPNAYLVFIGFLTSQKNTAGAAQVWNALAQLGKSFEPRLALPYIDYLISQHDVVSSELVWRQTMTLCGLSTYLASGQNLVVNSHFDSDILNGGFDWRYQRQANVEVALDPTEFHGGHRSLSVVFDGPAVDEAGISQHVPVRPNTTYDFSAYFKAGAMDGAGGPRLSIQDAYTGTSYFLSDDLHDTDVWREINAEFETGTNASLAVIKVVRVPSGRPIRGKLWLDDFRLSEKGTGS